MSDNQSPYGNTPNWNQPSQNGYRQEPQQNDHNSQYGYGQQQYDVQRQGYVEQRPFGQANSQQQAYSQWQPYYDQQQSYGYQHTYGHQQQLQHDGQQYYGQQSTYHGQQPGYVQPQSGTSRQSRQSRNASTYHSGVERQPISHMNTAKNSFSGVKGKDSLRNLAMMVGGAVGALILVVVLISSFGGLGGAGNHAESAVLLSSETGYVDRPCVNKSAYVYDKDGRLLQEVVYSRSGNNQYYVSAYTNYYYFGDGNMVDVEVFCSLYEGGSLKSETMYLYGYDLTGNRTDIESHQINISNGTSDRVYYQKINWDELNRYIVSEIKFYGTHEASTLYTYGFSGSEPLLISKETNSTSAIGNTGHTDYEYDSNGNCVTEVHTTYSDSDGWYDSGKTTYVYDSHRRLVKQTEYQPDSYKPPAGTANWVFYREFTWEYDNHDHTLTESRKSNVTDNLWRTTFIYGDPGKSQSLIMPYEREVLGIDGVLQRLGNASID